MHGTGFLVELELRLARADEHSDRVDLDVRVRPFRGGRGGHSRNHTTVLDLAELRAHDADPEAYGQVLARAVWADPGSALALQEILAPAGAENQPAHIVFNVGSSHVLAGIHWERLLDCTGKPLGLQRNVHLSRFAACDAAAGGADGARALKRAVVAIASPKRLQTHAFPPIDAQRHAAEAERILSGLEVQCLGVRCPVSIGQITQALRTRADLLLLVCHGAVGDDGARLWLGTEEEPDTAVLVGPEEVLSAVNAGPCPWLVIFGSCHSGASGLDPGASLAAALVGAGVPYVLTMHGSLSPETLSQILSEIFDELVTSGELARGLHRARGRLQQTGTDWSLPVLYTSTLTHVPVRVPRGTMAGEAYGRWPRVLDALERGSCIPVVGWGVHPSGTIARREVVSRLAARGSISDDLAGARFAEAMRCIVAEQGRSAAVRVLGEIISEDGASAPPPPHEPSGLPEYRSESGREDLEPAGDLLTRLVRLPATVFLTLDWFDHLSEALRREGKNPRVEYVRWNDRARLPPSLWTEEPDYTPTVEEPLVLHLFGRWTAAEPSLVLTDDDCFEFAVAVGEHHDVIPPAVVAKLPGSLLLLCGTDPDEHDARLFLRIYAGGTPDPRTDPDRHVTVQLDDEGRSLDLRTRTEEIVRHDFGGTATSVFWGPLARFLEALERERDHARL